MHVLTQFQVHAQWFLRAALLAGWLIAVGCRRPQDAGVHSRETTIVPVTQVGLQPMDRSFQTLGTLQAMDRATLSIKTTGRLRLLQVDVGSPVRAGDILAQVEPRDYELRLKQSAALLAQSRARLGLPGEGDDDRVEFEAVNTVREAKALLEESSKSLERIQKLVSQKIASETEFERASTEYQVTFNRYNDAIQDARERQAILAQRRAEFEIAKQQLSDTSLRAPFDGIVQERLTNVGEYLTSGSPVLSVVRVDPLRLRLEIPERQSLSVRPGLSVKMNVEGDTNEYTGRLLRISPALDAKTRMLIAEAEFRNPGTLRPGALARAHVLVAESVPTLAVPSNAVITFAGVEKIFLARTNRAVERQITTGRRVGGWVEVLSGLKSGDTIILRPEGLQSGDAIQEKTGEQTLPPSPKKAGKNS